MCERGILPVSPSSNSTVIRSPSSSKSSSPEGKGQSGREAPGTAGQFRGPVLEDHGIYIHTHTVVPGWALRATQVKDRGQLFHFRLGEEIADCTHIRVCSYLRLPPKLFCKSITSTSALNIKDRKWSIYLHSRRFQDSIGAVTFDCGLHASHHSTTKPVFLLLFVETGPHLSCLGWCLNSLCSLGKRP